MATIRCPECNATQAVPADAAVTSVRCGYCGANIAVHDAEARRRFLLEQQREARLAEQHHAALARDARREARDADDRRTDRQERRRGRWGMRLMTLIAVLAAPTIIAITVFDLPARLGFGASGADRLAQVATQLRATGCTTLLPIRSTYATGTVSQLVTTEPTCLRILAAGAGDHRSLSLRLYGLDSAPLARSDDSLDPQLTHCTPTAGTLRYEILVGPAAKGRLSHTVLACPAPPTPAPAPAPASGKPAAKPRQR